ncbi:hypothetical protein GIB67_033099 [Kingdonia uniflora]|uniref:Uncharacterized protein n=1 Tax=Kingdonia uniflora TaxID=39325 RepID=A0A7J7MYL3_9MAGN|nr:hypothetical protein GIB67_033099 [Kingdonia uniflora]
MQCWQKTRKRESRLRSTVGTLRKIGYYNGGGGPSLEAEVGIMEEWWNLVRAFENTLDKLAKEDVRAADIETIPRGEESQSLIMVEERNRRDNRTRYTKNHYEGKRKDVPVRRDDIDTCPEEPSFEKPRDNLKAFLPSFLKPQSVADRGRSISRERKSSNFERSPPALCDLTKKDKVLPSEISLKNPKPSSKFVVSASSEESSSSDRTMDDSVVIGIVTADNPSVSSERDVGLYVGDETRQFFKYPENVDVAKKFLQYKKSLDGEWGNYRCMDIGNDIDILYYNGTGSEVVEEGFLCYLNQVAYGLNIPITFFQKGVMNALMSFPGQLNGNIFEMMRVCEVLNQKWRDCDIARQFVADDVLKYYKFNYMKDRKSGYLFSDSSRSKFFDFESSGRPWCDDLVMVRGNCIQVPGEPALELIYKNFKEKPNPKVVTDTSSLFDVISREGSELNKVLGELGIRREKRLNSVVEKILPVGSEGVVADINMAPPLKKQKKEFGKDIQASSKGVNLEAVEQEALDLATRDPIRIDTQIRSSISQLSVAWKSAAEVLKLAATNHGKLVRQHNTKKVALQEQFEQEKVLQREQFEKEMVLQKGKFEKEAAATKQEVEDETKKAVVIAYGKIVFPGDDTSLVAEQTLAPPVAEQTPAPPVADDPTKEEVVHLRWIVIEMEKALSRARDSINRTQQKITPKRGKRATDTDHERQMADVIAFYGGELDRVENEFRRYISSCGKDVEVENDKVENMRFTKGNEGGGASTSKPRAEESKEEEVEDLLPHTRHKIRSQEVEIFNELLQVDASNSRVQSRAN